MTYNDGCWMRRRVALGLVAIWLSGCATVSSDVGRLAACPPVVEYSREFQAQAAEELTLLPEGSAIAVMLSDHTVMLERIRTRRQINLLTSGLGVTLLRSMPTADVERYG